jgi:hypothetical protein
LTKVNKVVSNNWTIGSGPSIRINGTFGKTIEPSGIAYNVTSFVDTCDK